MRAYLQISMGAVALLTASAANAVFVSAGSSTPTLLGGVIAGQSYTITATGIADLLNGFNGGQGVTFDANGIPTYAFPPPYSAFYPSGLDYDPSQGPTAFGVGGAGRLYGALLGTGTATPSSPADYTFLGSSFTFTAGLTGPVYGIVNDCANCYSDNNAQSGFNVTLSLTDLGVPEPATWAMMLVGFGAMGFALRRRKRLVARPA
jgi:hypothetical protein